MFSRFAGLIPVNPENLVHPVQGLFSWNSFRISTFSSTARLIKDKESPQNAPDS